ncbi:hypothetical protein RX476_05410 [Faecalibacterium prausnitzii]|jgi:hypothetical protein|uniref:hypothetical protein n=1 Tax=Faecalibacterium prausnitzii TaxID=853 RepID=UPI001F3FD139|nr:hypothetical protein [Faecalibacterium prausnitzii]MDU8724231.1 hypothetical protein [Faecalibacterium prausnitzii]
MMMPANFSAVSENEMTYVMGGSVADYLAPVMGKKEWSNFSKNLVTIIGNSYLGNFVNNTLGVIFSGTYVPGGVLSNFGSDISGIWNANFDGTDTKSKILSGMAGVLNVGLNIAGNLAAIYNLGFGTVKNGAEKAAITEFSATDLL